MRKTSKKLNLSRETLRNLDAMALGTAQGGTILTVFCTDTCAATCTQFTLDCTFQNSCEVCDEK